MSFKSSLYNLLKWPLEGTNFIRKIHAFLGLTKYKMYEPS